MTLLKALENLIKYSEIYKDELPILSQAKKDLKESIQEVEYALLPIGTQTKEVSLIRSDEST
jgi:hypothetical protein